MSYVFTGQAPNAKAGLQQAIACQRQGRLREAEALYRQVLNAQAAQPEAAIGLFSILAAAGRFPDMESLAQQLVERAPRAGMAWKGLAVARLSQGKDALQACEMAAKHLPDDPTSHENLALALKKSGRLADAELCFRRALKFAPNNPAIHVNLGNTLLQLGDARAALACCRKALELDPKLAIAHNSLGNAHRELVQLEDAIACYQRAAALAPALVEAHYNLGWVLKDLDRYMEAEASLQRALQLQPELPQAHYTLSFVYYAQGRQAQAQASLQRALALQPDNLTMRVAQTILALPVVPDDVEQARSAVPQFQEELLRLAEWKNSQPQTDAAALTDAVFQLPFYLAYRNGNHCAPLSDFCDLFAADRPLQARREPHGRARLLIVCSHFRRHSVWDVIVRGLLTHLDRSRFEVVLYHLGLIEDDQTKEAQRLADVWRDLHSVPGGDWAQYAEMDRPDVIFYPEIGMDPTCFKLACRRLAPLQIASWGHPITSGTPTIDLYLSGELLEPANADAHYRERLVRLPGTGCCTAPVEVAPAALGDLDATLHGKTGGRFVIAQAPYKLDPADDRLFAQIAAEVGDCHFILFANERLSWATEKLMRRMANAFTERGLDPARHLVLLPWLSQGKFLTLLDQTDVFLDCPSFSGYTTAWLATQRGVPVLTWEGEYMRQRLAAGLLRKIGVTDTIATSAEQYVAIAKHLAAECAQQQQRARRRERLLAAAPTADHDVRVVRAFEQEILRALDERCPPSILPTAA